MISKFRKKTIRILTLIFWVILAGILLTINISNSQSNLSETRKLLSNQEMIVDKLDTEHPVAPEDGDKEISMIYSVAVSEGEYEVVFSPAGGGYGTDELIRIAKGMEAADENDGIMKHFRYVIKDTETGHIISFIDYSIWEHQQYRMMIYSALIGLGGMAVLFLIAVLLTGWLIKPVVTAFDKQKQFISDAGHELKTPLTVMKSSLDMLENEYGNNKYFGYLREENNRMTALVYEMLSLSGLEAADKKINFEKVDLSRTVQGTCLPFECLAFEHGLKLDLQIQEGIWMSGNESQLKQLIDVLLDNAIKHTHKNGAVAVQLKKERGKVLLQVKNEGDPIPEAERTKIFDRFYRIDKARNRTEGRYGLGLSIAGSIAEAHNGRISVDSKDGWTIFCVKFIV